MYLPSRLHAEKRYYAELLQFTFCRDLENEVKVKTHGIYFTCLSNMSMKKYDNDPSLRMLFFAAIWQF